MMKIFDTHAHYNLSPLYEDWQKHWKKAQEKGIVGSTVVGTTIETSKKAIEIAKQEKNLYATVGIHPGKAHEFEVEETIKKLDKLLSKNKKSIVAIGEIGLDYYRLDRDSKNFKQIRQKQHDFLEAQIKLAEKYDLPLVFHVRDKAEFYGQESGAYAETLAMIKKHYIGHKPFVLHCISGTLGYITQAVELGAYIGFCANITYKNADDIRNIVKHTPMNRLLIETDAPYLPPQKHRGKVCEPWMISETAKFVKEAMQIEPEWLLENTEEFYGIEI